MDHQSQVKIVHSDKKIGKCDTCNKELSIKYITQHKKLVHITVISKKIHARLVTNPLSLNQI